MEWLIPTIFGVFLAGLSALQTWALVKIMEHEEAAL